MAYKIIYGDGEGEGEDDGPTFAIQFRDGAETDAYDCEDADGGMAIVEHPKLEGTFVLVVLRDHEGQLSPDTIYELRQATTVVEEETDEEDGEEDGVDVEAEEGEEGEEEGEGGDDAVEIDGKKVSA